MTTVPTPRRCIAVVVFSLSTLLRAAADAQVARADIVTQMLNVDGAALRVRTAGLAARIPGQPVVVFESGGSMPLETWDPILPSIAAFAPVIAYDRSGTGQSPWDSLPPAPGRVISRLRRLLVELNVRPPYVLVRHSWGGALIRYFGGTFPTDIAGMVYIDPTDITQEPADEVAIFESIGSSAAARSAFHDLMEKALTNAPAALRAEGAMTLRILKQTVSDRQLPAAPDVPTTVILAGKAPRMPQRDLPFDGERYVNAMQQQRLTRLRSWVRADGEFLVDPNAGHFVHADNPQLVIEAIRRIVQTR